jgi:hypothetical protein
LVSVSVAPSVAVHDGNRCVSAGIVSDPSPFTVAPSAVTSVAVPVVAVIFALIVPAPTR